jgi:hypothetical protein
VYKTTPAMKTVRISPGTRPKTEYDHGNDMMARQMYSEKSSAAVYRQCDVSSNTCPITSIMTRRADLLPTASSVLDGILSLQFDLLAHAGSIFGLETSMNTRHATVSAGWILLVIILFELCFLGFFFVRMDRFLTIGE